VLLSLHTVTQILVVANAKGGAGKTTISLGLAAEAAHRGRRVLLIDADVQGNATEHLIGKSDPMRPQGDRGEALHRLMLDGGLPTVTPVKPGFGLIPAGPRTQDLSDELARLFRAGPETQLQALRFVRTTMHAVLSDWDFVVIDTPPSEQSGPLLDCFLAASDELLIPVRPSPEHAFAAFRLLARLVGLSERGAETARPVGVVLFDLPANATRIAHSAAGSLQAITDHVPLFNTIMGHRQGPAATAARLHLAPRELVRAVSQSSSRRFAALRNNELPPPDVVGVSAESATRFAQDFVSLYEELMTRHGAVAV
jgi:cellulose biosynthesis protein BcsQ